MKGPWGAWAIRKLLMQTTLDELQGTLRIVPVCNPFAMEADARNAPFDSLDLNRVFPGSADGSHTERIAAILTEHAINGANIAIDLHGGGSWCVNAFSFPDAGWRGAGKGIWCAVYRECARQKGDTYRLCPVGGCHSSRS